MIAILAATMLLCAQDSAVEKRILQRIDRALQEYRERLREEIRKVIVEELDRSSTAPRKPVYLGVTQDDFTDQERKALNVPGGIKIAEVRGPAQKAGLRAGDILLELNGEPVTEETLGRLLEACAPGDEVNCVVLRQRRRQTFKVVLAPRE